MLIKYFNQRKQNFKAFIEKKNNSQQVVTQESRTVPFSDVSLDHLAVIGSKKSNIKQNWLMITTDHVISLKNIYTSATFYFHSTFFLNKCIYNGLLIIIKALFPGVALEGTTSWMAWVGASFHDGTMCIYMRYDTWTLGNIKHIESELARNKYGTVCS